MRRTLLALPAFLIFLIPGVVEAQGLVACKGLNCGTCEFVATVNNVVAFLVAIASIVATIILVYVGLRLVVSAGNTEVESEAKQMIWNIVLGLFFVIAAYAIINVIMMALVPSGSPILPWEKVQCINAVQPVGPSSGFSSTSVLSTLDTSMATSNVGACNTSKLEPTFGSLSDQASCIIQHESVCGSLLESTSDRTADDQAFSWGVMQINLNQNTLNGCTGSYNPSGGTLNCPNAFSGTNYDSTIVNGDLYNRCVEAALDFECNVKNGKRIYNEWGSSWGAWSTAGDCGLN